MYALSDIDKSAEFDNFSTTTSYGMQGVWRSAILPGWGQIYKGSTVKGGLMFSGTVAFAGVAVFANYKNSNYLRNMAESYSSDNKRYYADKADSMANLRNISIGAAAAVYIYSLIDAAVAPGAKRVKVTKSGGSYITFSPVSNAEMYGGALTYRF